MAESSSFKHLEEKNVDLTAVSKSNVRFHKKAYKEMVKLKGHSLNSIFQHHLVLQETEMDAEHTSLAGINKGISRRTTGMGRYCLTPTYTPTCRGRRLRIT